jgi:dihydroneopterin aldolase
VITPTVEIRGLRVFAHHGVLIEERRRGQEFVIDLELVCQPSNVDATDEVADTVNYAEVCERTVELMRGGPYNLIEKVADVIAGDLHARFGLQQVTVRVAKPNAPLPFSLSEVAVTITHPPARRRRPAKTA